MIVGIRTDESFNRYRGVAAQLRDDNWISEASAVPHSKDQQSVGKSHYINLCKPIYDWGGEDVWIGIHGQGWDYNIAYDIMYKTGAGGPKMGVLRVAPPYGEEPLLALWLYAVCWPDLWAKMIMRVPGAATAGRYARTELYGYGFSKPPEGMHYREYIKHQLMRFNPEDRKKIAYRIRKLIDNHNRKTNFTPLTDEEAHPLTGMSWRFMAQIATRGDFKGRKVDDTAVTRMRADAKKRKERDESKGGKSEKDSSGDTVSTAHENILGEQG